MNTKQIVTSDDVYDELEIISNLAGKRKLARLRDAMEYEIFSHIVVDALCPFTTYGVKKTPDPAGDTASVTSIGGTAIFSPSTAILLMYLAERKLTGGRALEAISKEYARLTLKSRDLLDRVIKKDLRAGFSANSVNKVAPNTIPTFSCMLAHKWEEKRIKEFPVAVEAKLDGVRVVALRVPAIGGDYRFFSRTGKEFEAYRHLGKELDKLSNTSLVFDGEVVDESGEFNKTVGDAHRKDTVSIGARFNVFDVFNRDEFDYDRVVDVYSERKTLLFTLFNLCEQELNNVIYHGYSLANSYDEISSLYNEFRDSGLEGAIVKPLNGKYVRKRSYDWLKIKDTQSVDVPVVGWVAGAGKYANMLGALIVDVGGVAVNVGTGLSDQQRSEMWLQRDINIGRLVEVEYHEKLTTGSLRHPRFIRFRDDKPIDDGIGV